MTFTKEQLTSEIETLEHFATNLKWTNVKGAQSLLFAAEVMRQALAGMESEPVAWTTGTYSQNKGFTGEAKPDVSPVLIMKYWDKDTFNGNVEWLREAIENTGAYPLYAAPQPLTAAERQELQEYRNAQQVVPDGIANRLKAEGVAELLKDAREYAPLTAGQWDTLANNWHQTFTGLADNAKPCRAAMQSGAVKDEWVACSDRMPEESGDYLVLCHYPEFHPRCCVQHVMNFQHTAYNTPVMRWYDSERAKHITHWMPLPAAPQQEEL